MREPVPADQFARVQEEMRKLNLQLEEIERAGALLDATRREQSLRDIHQAAHYLEIAGMFMAKAVKPYSLVA